MQLKGSSSGQIRFDLPSITSSTAATRSNRFVFTRQALESGNILRIECVVCSRRLAVARLAAVRIAAVRLAVARLAAVLIAVVRIVSP